MLYPRKYKILRIVQKEATKAPTPEWKPVLIHFGIVPPSRVIAPGEVRRNEPKNLEQLVDYSLEPKYEKDNKENTEVHDFQVNMTYVLSSLFCADLNQPSMVEGDFTAEKPAMDPIFITDLKDKVMEEAGMLKKLTYKNKRIFADKMVFDRAYMTMFHLKPIYVSLHLE